MHHLRRFGGARNWWHLGGRGRDGLSGCGHKTSRNMLFPLLLLSLSLFSFSSFSFSFFLPPTAHHSLLPLHSLCLIGVTILQFWLCQDRWSPLHPPSLTPCPPVDPGFNFIVGGAATLGLPCVSLWKQRPSF